MTDYTYTVWVVSGGRVRQDREYVAPEPSVEEFGRLLQAELSVRPMPWPDAQVQVFAGTDTRGEPGFGFRHRRVRELSGSAL